jgi:trans-2-enoyl-CoA reductase
VDGCLKAENLLAPERACYLFIGPSLTEAVYRKGTIGRAKDDLKLLLLSLTAWLTLTESLCFCKQSLSNTSKFSYTCYSFVYFFIIQNNEKKKVFMKVVLNKFNVCTLIDCSLERNSYG